MSACVSPPQPSVSHIVEVAAIIAQAASTALPPFMKVAAPAVAASGLPVTATQFCPCSAGLTDLAEAEQVSVSVAARMIAWVRVFMPQLYPDRAGISARMRIRVGLKPDLQ